jgi:hypothetical protein
MSAPKSSLVSKFELLIAPIAPRFPANGLNAPNADLAIFARRVIQGYFLTISNPDCTNDFAFSLIFTNPRDNSANPIPGKPTNKINNEITMENHISLFANDGLAKLKPIGYCGGSQRWSTEIHRIPPGDTVLFALLPNFLDDTIRNEAQISIRGIAIQGFVEILQEGISSGVGPFVTKTLPAVPVLLTPEHRGTFLPNQLGSTGPVQAFDVLGNATPGTAALPANLDFDQLSYALPLAEGKALYALGGGDVTVGTGKDDSGRGQ